MRTWEIVKHEMEMVERKMLKDGLNNEQLEKEYFELKKELEEIKPMVYYTVYTFDMGEYREEGKIQSPLITDPIVAGELMMELQCKAMTCKVDGETQHIQYYNIDGEWYPLILGMGRTLQKIGTQWAKNMKKSIKMYSFGRYEEHEAVYNEEMETVSFS